MTKSAYFEYPEFTITIDNIEKITPEIKPKTPNQRVPINHCRIELKIKGTTMKGFFFTDADTLTLVSEDKTKAILLKTPKFLLTKEEVAEYL